jgi:hypothetical protein
MSLAIKFGTTDGSVASGFIYIDATTQYSREFKGQVTSHAIGSGGSISDHFIRSNPVYPITGVISGADISIGRKFILSENGVSPDNVSEDVPNVLIKGNGTNLLSLLPNSVSQFFVDTETVADVSTVTRKGKLNEIRTLLEGLFEKDTLSLVTLYEYTDNKLAKYIPSLVMTSLSFSESPDSGIALYVNITLERVDFVELETRTLTSRDLRGLNSKSVNPSIKNQAAINDPKGNQPPKALPDYALEFRERVAAKTKELTDRTASAFLIFPN